MTVFYPLQRSITPRHRTARWVGKPRIKLAERLDKKLAEMGYESKIEVSYIRPASGAWRTDQRLDVLRVEGHLEIKGPATLGCWMTRNLESWSTITDMLRYGFDVEIGSFEVSLSAAATPAQKAAAANYEKCLDCGLNTHKEEAACLHCGHTKAWAQPEDTFLDDEGKVRLRETGK